MSPITLSLSTFFLLAGLATGVLGNRYLGLGICMSSILIALSVNVADVWQKFVILRAGKLRGVKSAGFFIIIPVLDRVMAVIDERIQTMALDTQVALTRDTVPVNVDAVVFWRVHDARMAALAITDYVTAVDQLAQTSLRQLIGASSLTSLLSGRAAAGVALRNALGDRIADWGITVEAVAIRDITIPAPLQAAMPRQAQAEREKQARVILGSAEAEIASRFVEAARVYENHPGALQLRAMNIIYETTKERGATILIPSAMVDSLNPALAVAGYDVTSAAPAPSLKNAA